MTSLTPDEGRIIVTGGGSGLGRAMARGFATAGFDVTVFGRRADALGETARGVPRISAHPLDIARPEDVARAIRTIAAQGPIAALVNNAAIYPHEDFLTGDPGTILDAVAINLGGTVTCSYAVLQDMALRGRGRIVNVATFADLNPLPGSAAYSVSKGAQRIFTRALIAEVGDRLPGIVISDWIPGALRTDMGLADGIPPEVAAGWGVALTLAADRNLTGVTFERDREVLHPVSFKRKVFNTLTGQTPRPRRITERGVA
ncbi:SDR family oxidoreductase [Roseivivax sp. CAU 1753]